MDFGSFENTIDKNIETDKVRTSLTEQVQAYKDAGNSLTLAKSSLGKAAGSLQEAKENLIKSPIKRTLLQKPLIALLQK